MPGKIKFIEVNYHCHREFTTAAEVIKKHLPSNLFAKGLSEQADIILVKHLNYTAEYSSNGIRYRFFKSKKNFFHIPFATHRFIKKEKPDIILVQGFIFPLQVIFLRMKIGKQAKIILQHHAEIPFRRKRIFQKIADRFVDAYLFSSTGNANEWLASGIIRNRQKIYELPSSSTTFLKQNKKVSQQTTGMDADINFLWVGRLNANKDPVTVLKAFEKYFSSHPESSLYMIYAEDDILNEVKDMIRQSNSLPGKVKLIGQVPNQELETWYSAADYFVSGSHQEGGSYALVEAMTCGCVPIVTNIPSAMKTIDAGKAGYYFEPGDSEGLFNILSALDKNKQEELSSIAGLHFKNHLSPGAVARLFYSICEDLKSK